MRRSPRLRRLRAAFCLLFPLAAILAAVPAQAFRIVAYNCLDYDNLASTRDPAFRTVLSGISNIDVLAVEEMTHQSSITNFLNNVLNVVEPGQWAAAPYYDDPSSNFNPGLFYRTSAVTFVSSDTLGNTPRSIPYYTLRPKPYTSGEASFVIFVCHLKASDTSTDAQTRYEEATRIRNRMNSFPAGTNMMVVGDLNLYTSSEQAYQKLLGSEANNIGRLQDPINTPGSWHNSATYAPIHTQSTRTGYLNPNDGGSTGGMDDRFDFILPTYSLADGQKLDQLSSTYISYGNDGQHFNLNINDSPTNSAVGQTIADALQRASDHLPVRLDFQVPAIVSADASLTFGTVIVGATAQQTLHVSNGASAPADILDYTLAGPTGFTAPGGTFHATAGAGSNDHTVTMATASAGVKSGNLAIASDDVDHPTTDVPLSGTVLRHAVPSLSALSPVSSTNLDFGAHDEGGFVPGDVGVANYGYDSLQALLNVYDASITGGDGRFSVSGGFTASDVGGTAAGYQIIFDDSGASRSADTTYTATLTFSTRDQQGLAGAANQPDLTVNLSATVNGTGQTGIGDEPRPVVTALRANHPNPFLAATSIRFDLARSTVVRLSVFDIQGRPVRTLVNGTLGAGSHDLAWDGRTGSGRAAGPGIYFYRLETPEYTATQRMVKLR